MSFQISITPSRRAAARHVTQVRWQLQKAFAEEADKRGLTQAQIARTIGVHRSVINRELRGHKDITIGRVGELAYAMGRLAMLTLPEMDEQSPGVNIVQQTAESSGETAKGTIKLETVTVQNQTAR